MLSFDYWSATITICVFLLFVVGYIYTQRKLSYWKRLGIPSPDTHWLFGNFKDAILGRTSVGKHLGKLHLEGGDEPCIGIYIMHKPFLLMRDPAMIKQVLVKDFNIFQNRYFAAERSRDLITTTSLFSIKNPEWKYLRSKLSTVFSSGKQKKLFSLMIESSENMRGFLNKQFEDGDKVKIFETKDMSVRFITDVISSLAFGVRSNSFSKDVEFFDKCRTPFKKPIQREFRNFATFFFPILKNVLRKGILGDSYDYFRDLFSSVMNEREKSGLKRGDSIDPLLQIKQERSTLNFELVDDTLLAQPIIFYIAGTESSSSAIAFTLLEFAKNPSLQDRARKEVQKELAEHGFTYEAIKELKFLQQAISETLRIYPAVPLIDRVALQDYQLPGTDIVLKKGTVFYVSLNGIHEDPRYFPDPLTYDPDRFSDERKSEINPFAYLPFGEGPRSCIGERVGMLQTTVGLATILQDFEVCLNPMYKNEINPRAIFAGFVGGVRLEFRKIST